MTTRRKRSPLEGLTLEEGMPAVLHLVAPKEQVWGVLLSLGQAGVEVRGIDMRTFDEWVHQEVHSEEERLLGLSTLFYPMHRIERIERDETIGAVEGYAARVERESGIALTAIVVRDANAATGRGDGLTLTAIVERDANAATGRGDGLKVAKVVLRDGGGQSPKKT